MNIPTEYRSLKMNNIYTMTVHSVLENTRNFNKQGGTYYAHVITFTDGEFLYKTEYPSPNTSQDIFRTGHKAQFEVIFQKNMGTSKETQEIELRGNPAQWDSLEDTKKTFVYRPMKGESYEIALYQSVHLHGLVYQNTGALPPIVDILTYADEMDRWLKAKQETQNSK